MPMRTEDRRASPSEQTDLWEHACLLFHNFEWQDAADTFNYLRQTTSDPESQALCFLNTGLILARLGEFTYAHQAFDNALRLDRHEPITHYLLGLTEAELGDVVKAQARFEMCVEKMRGGDLDYHDRQLDFVLTTDAVKSNAVAMWNVMKSQCGASPGTSLPAALERLPVDVLFEAPPRSWSSIPGVHRSIKMETSRDPEFWEGSERHSDPHYETTETRSLSSTRSSQRTERSLKHSILHTTARTPSSERSGEALSLDLEPPDLSIPARAPNRNLAPRDARVVDESMKDLASFIRHAGPATGGREVVTIDRDYMLRLLQNDIDSTPKEGSNEDPRDVAEAGPGDYNGRDGIDSVLDLYVRYSDNFLPGVSVSPRPESEPDLPPAGSYSLFPPLRPQVPPDKSIERTKSIPRKPVPGRAAAIPRSVPIVPNHTATALPTFTTQATSDPHPGTPYVPSSPEPRRAGQTTAERWLRKEVRPPWARRKGFGDMAKADRDRTPSNDGSEGLETLPSTVSSMEIFGFGLRGIGRGRR